MYVKDLYGSYKANYKYIIVAAAKHLYTLVQLVKCILSVFISFIQWPVAWTMSLKRSMTFVMQKLPYFFPPNSSWNVFTTSYLNDKTKEEEKKVAVSVNVGAIRSLAAKRNTHGSFVYSCNRKQALNKTKTENKTSNNLQPTNKLTIYRSNRSECERERWRKKERKIVARKNMGQMHTIKAIFYCVFLPRGTTRLANDFAA